MRRHVVFLAPDLFSIYEEFVRGLKQVGARVTAVGHTPTQRIAPRLRHYADDYVRVGSLLDVGNLVAAGREIGKRAPIDLIETGDETMVLPAAQMRQALGVPGTSVRTATLCRDKPAMKDALRAAGVPTAASAGVSSLAELEAFVEREGYPVILKPRSALGGLSTFKAGDAKELQVAAARLHIDKGSSVAVEEFVEGHEGFYDTLSLEGRVQHEFISHYYPNVLPALADRTVAPQIASTNRVGTSSYDELKDMGRKVIEALGIETSATHMEWFFGPKGLKFSEIGARPPGEKIWDLYCVGNDMDLYLEWALMVVHGKIGSRPSRRFATGSVQVRPDRDGTVVGYEGLEALRNRFRAWIWAFEVPKPGSPTAPIHKGYLNNTWFRLRHPSYDRLLEMMTEIGDKVRMFAR